MYILGSIEREKAVREMSGENTGSIESLVKDITERRIPECEYLEAFIWKYVI